MGRKKNPTEGHPLDAESLKMREQQQLNKELNVLRKRQNQLVKKMNDFTITAAEKKEYKILMDKTFVDLVGRVLAS